MPFSKTPVDSFGNVATDVFPHTKIFLSTEQTGSGAAQSIAHGLGATPSIVAIFVTGDARLAWGAVSIVEGTHTNTNVVVTVTTDIKYRVLALA